MARTARSRGKGGSKKGHEFYGNQYTRVAKYSRRKSSGKRRRRRGAVGKFGRSIKKFATDNPVAAVWGATAAGFAIAGSSPVQRMARGKRPFRTKFVKQQELQTRVDVGVYNIMKRIQDNAARRGPRPRRSW